jgi:hypothetical protein
MMEMTVVEHMGQGRAMCLSTRWLILIVNGRVANAARIQGDTEQRKHHSQSRV